MWFIAITFLVQVGCVVFRLKSPGVPSWVETLQVENEASTVVVSAEQPSSGVWVVGRTQYCSLSITTDKAFHSLNITLRTHTPELEILPVENGAYSIEVNYKCW